MRMMEEDGVAWEESCDENLSEIQELFPVSGRVFTGRAGEVV